MLHPWPPWHHGIGKAAVAHVVMHTVLDAALSHPSPSLPHPLRPLALLRGAAAAPRVRLRRAHRAALQSAPHARTHANAVIATAHCIAAACATAFATPRHATPAAAAVRPPPFATSSCHAATRAVCCWPHVCMHGVGAVQVFTDKETQHPAVYITYKHPRCAERGPHACSSMLHHDVPQPCTTTWQHLCRCGAAQRRPAHNDALLPTKSSVWLTVTAAAFTAC